LSRSERAHRFGVVEAPVARAAVDRQPLRPVQPEMQVLTDAEIARPWTAYGELAADAARKFPALVVGCPVAGSSPWAPPCGGANYWAQVA
jgi:hypothetical protein